MPLLSERKNGPSLKPKKKKTLKIGQEIREKLSGKNYSPIVAKSRKELIKKKKVKSSKVVAKENDRTSSPLKAQPPVKKEKTIKENPLKRTFETVKENLPESQKKKRVSFESDFVPKKSKEEKIVLVKPSLKKKKSNEVQPPSESLVKINKANKKTTKVHSLAEPALITKKINRTVKNLNNVQSNKSITILPGVTKKKLKNQKPQAVKKTDKTLSTTVEPAFKKPNKKRKSSATNSQEVNTDTAESQEVEVKEEVKSDDLPSKKAGKKKVKQQDILKPISNIKSLRKRPTLKAKSLKQTGKVPKQGVCIFKNIPHGFYEKELKSYCSQFGKVTGVYLPVSKNGNSRGYAFVRFAHREVAEVVAETMNNYVMFFKRIRCEMVPKEREKPGMFKMAKSNAQVANEKREAGLKQRMRQLSKPEIAAWEKRKKDRISALHKKLSALGVDYEFKVNDNTKNSSQQSPRSTKVK